MYDDFAFEMAYGDGEVSNLEAEPQIAFEELNSFVGSSLEAAAVHRVEKQLICLRAPVVTFAEPWLNTHHEVTPYAEVYGIHPSSFDFDKRVAPPSWCFVGDAESDSDEDEQEKIGTTSAYSRQMINKSSELLHSCAWELRKADHGGKYDAEQDAVDDERDTQSPDSSDVNSDGSAEFNMDDELATSPVHNHDSDIDCGVGQPMWCPCCRELLQNSPLENGTGFAASCFSCNIEVSVKHRNGQA
jgi:hypothetical protein